MIVYLHGFGSSGNSAKAQALRDHFGDENVWCPDLPVDPSEVSKMVKAKIGDWFMHKSEEHKLVFVGTSLGAFYATYYGFLFDAPFVIVNPSINPSRSLQRKLGKNINHVTQEEFMVSLVDLEKLADMKDLIDRNYNGSLVHLFVAKDDDVIPYEQMLSYYKFTASTHVEETGGHRFAEHWDKVVDKVAELVQYDENELRDYTL
jgi:uncharacterized protein